MDELALPPSPTLTRFSMIKTTPDDRLLICNQNLTVIKRIDESNKTAITSVTVSPVVRPHCVIVNEMSYNSPNCYAAVAGSNTWVVMIDLKTESVKKSCNVWSKKLQLTDSRKNMIRAITFVNDNILIITECGDLANWKTEENKCSLHPKFLNERTLKIRVDVTCMAACPHKPYLIAIGLRSGYVVLADLNQTPYSFCKIQNYSEQIYCISWCPAPFNIQEIKENAVSCRESDDEERPEDTIQEWEQKIPIETDQLKNSEVIENVEVAAVKNEPVATDTDNDADQEIYSQAGDESNAPMSPVSEAANGNEMLPQYESDVSPAKIVDWNTLIEMSDEERQQKANDADEANHEGVADENVITDCKESPDEQTLTSDNRAVIDREKSDSENEVSFGCDIIKYNERKQQDIDTPKVKNNKNPWLNINKTTSRVGGSTYENSLAEIKSIQKEFNAYLNEHKLFQQHDYQKNRQYRTIIDVDQSNVKDSYIFLVASHFEIRIYDALNPRTTLLSTKYKVKADSRGRHEFSFTPAVWVNERTIAFGQGYQIRYFDFKNYIDVTSLKTHIVMNREPIYALTTPFKYVSFEDLQTERTEEAIIWSLDLSEYLSRSILSKSFDRVTSYPLCKNVINRFSISPHNNMDIAFCTQSNYIYLWKIHPANPFAFNMIQIMVKGLNNATVLCIVYHPVIENCVAISLSAGPIKLCSVSDALLSRFVDVSEKNVMEVYSLSWGPFEGRICLYAVVEGKIRIYNTEDLKKKLASKEFVSIRNATTVSWNPDLNTLAIGLDNGCVSFYNTNLQLMNRTYVCTSFIFKLIWHRSTFDDEKNTSPLRSAIAFVAKERTVYVYDPRCKSDDVGLIASLVGHEHYVYDASWSPFQSNLLVTASADYTAKVWDVIKGVQIASFNNHGNELYSVCWMPNHPDFIMSSGLDINLRFWNYKNYPPCFEELDLRKKRLKKGIVDLTIVETKTGENHNETNSEQNNECDRNQNGVVENTEKENCMMENGNNEQSTSSSVATKKSNDRRNRGRDRRRSDKTITSENTVSTVADASATATAISANTNNNDCVCGESSNKGAIEVAISRKSRSKNERNAVKDSRLLALCYDNSQDSILDAAEALLKPDSYLKNTDNALHKFFSDNYDDVYDFLNLEQERMEKNRNKSSTESLYLWRSKIAKCIEKSYENSTLTERLVALAPMVSHELWVKSCYQLGKQYQRKGELQKAVDYFVATHKTQEALDVYVSAKMYREAYIFAKCHYPPSSEIFGAILDKWANYSLETGCYEIASLCLIKQKEYEKAALLLCKRTNNREVLELALKIADHLKNSELVQAIRFKISTLATIEQNSVDKNDNDDHDNEDGEVVTIKKEADHNDSQNDPEHEDYLNQFDSMRVSSEKYI